MPKKQSPAGGQVRPAGPRDLARVLDIWYEANCQAHSFIPAAYWLEKRPLVAGLLPEAQLLVWEEAGQVAGFLGLQGDYLAGIFVQPGQQGRGIGRQLLQRAMELRDRLTLDVYEENPRARAFYLRMGFVAAGRSLDEETGRWQETLCWERRPQR